MSAHNPDHYQLILYVGNTNSIGVYDDTEYGLRLATNKLGEYIMELLKIRKNLSVLQCMIYRIPRNFKIEFPDYKYVIFDGEDYLNDHIVHRNMFDHNENLLLQRNSRREIDSDEDSMYSEREEDGEEDEEEEESESDIEIQVEEKEEEEGIEGGEEKS